MATDESIRRKTFRDTTRAAAFAVAIGSAGACAAPTETVVRADCGPRIPFRREIVGVNHLAYGKDGLGYGMILPGTHDLDPRLVAWQGEIGFGSLRYPGGCGGTHRFEWKRNAGLEGDYSVMGVLEFLGMCESCGATPVMGISAHRGTPAEAAEYVEFLNTPADASHPWAARRAARGHPEPFGVEWFEFGNEPYHGMTCSVYANGGIPTRPITVDGYCDAYLAFREAMRAVDPSVRLGVALSGGGSLWDRTVFARLGGVADFFVVHTYASVPPVRDGGDFLALFADRSEYLAKRFAEITAAVGDRTRIAVTEFNARQTQHMTLAAALVNLATLMDFAAEPHVVLADCWQFVNEGFGMVRGERDAFVKRPNAWAFQLFSRHTLDVLVPATVSGEGKGGALRSDGSGGGAGRPGEPSGWFGRNAMDGLAFQYRDGGTPENTGTRYDLLPDGTHRLTFLDDRQTNFYQLSARMNGLPPGRNCHWKVSCEMWTEPSGAHPVEARLDIVDGRGWDATKSAAQGESVSGLDPVAVSFVYEPLEDNPGSLLLRFRRTGTGAAGRVCVRNLRVEAVPKTRPDEPAVRAQLSVSADGRLAAAVLVNRSFETRRVAIRPTGLLPGGVGRAEGVVLSGPDAYATNEENPDAVRLRPLTVAIGDADVSFAMPPHSAAGIRLFPLQTTTSQHEKESDNEK